jgi:hypothetical protein
MYRYKPQPQRAAVALGIPNSLHDGHAASFRLLRAQEFVSGIRHAEKHFPVLDVAFLGVQEFKHDQIHRPAIITSAPRALEKMGQTLGA